jgi:hypothetical protein
MNKFWEWMVSKEYAINKPIVGGYAIKLKSAETRYVSKNICMNNKNILIGYMLEYIQDHDFWKEYKHSERFRNDNSCKFIDINNRLGLISECNNMYLELEFIINEMDDEV